MKLRSIYPICVSLSEKNAERTIAVGRNFPFVEVRLDAGRFTAADVKKVFQSLKNAVVTCRPGLYDDESRLELFSIALNTGARFVDIEIESSAKLRKELIKLAKKRKARSILSYHNYEITPSKRILNSIIKKAKASGADVVKIATNVRDERDTKILLALLSEHEKLVVIGMGEAGKSIRIASPMLGGLFTFAAPEVGKETAPGQIVFSVLREMYFSLGMIC
jgi:3-dehydroquinate dehydratase-1